MIDLTNQSFGKLKVIQRDNSKNTAAVYWICKCECGKEVSVRGDRLRKGEKTNCGCIKKSQKVDLTSIKGQNFSYWTVLERDLTKEIGHGKDSYWICKCKCGKIKSIRKRDLTTGHSKSCGCYKAELLSQKNTIDLTNKRFGKLMCIKNTQTKNSHNSYIWECICDCGNVHYVSAEDLNQERIYSCGCNNRSHGEEKIAKLLAENNIDYISEYSFSDCRSPKTNRMLRYDFALLKDNKVIKLIEFDGIQHYEKKEFFGGEEGYNYLKHCDELKNNYALKNNIPLLRIPYFELKNITIEKLLKAE